MMYSQNDIANLGTILGIWAHPDDEAFCMAGLMSYAVRNKQRVVIVVATDGAAGQSADEKRWPLSDLGITRTKELEQSLSIFGITELKMLNSKDGSLSEQNAGQVIKSLAEIIDQVKPDTVVSFNEDGLTGHSDHQTIHSWTKKAIEMLEEKPDFYCVVECREVYESYGRYCDEKFNIFFNAVEPQTYSKKEVDLCIELDDRAKADKEQALRAHASQTTHMFESKEDRELYINSVCTCECYIRMD